MADNHFSLKFLDELVNTRQLVQRRFLENRVILIFFFHPFSNSGFSDESDKGNHENPEFLDDSDIRIEWMGYWISDSDNNG